jgi:hypothetical protein
MPEETTTVAELRALLARKECELFGANYSSMANAAQVHYINALTREVEELRRQVAALAPKWELGPVGGSRVTTGFLPKPEPVESDDRHSHGYDPFMRAAEEFGWSTD